MKKNLFKFATALLFVSFSLFSSSANSACLPNYVEVPAIFGYYNGSYIFICPAYMAIDRCCIPTGNGGGDDDGGPIVSGE